MEVLRAPVVALLGGGGCGACSENSANPAIRSIMRACSDFYTVSEAF